VAGAAGGGAPPQALRIMVKARIKLKNHANFFIFLLLE
jgi:hypothetical protein